ncbi:MAG: hypothetical protein WC783_01045 [Candidatus Paceibacterota bacterium]|jgi:hypothetical protein
MASLSDKYLNKTLNYIQNFINSTVNHDYYMRKFFKYSDINFDHVVFAEDLLNYFQPEKVVEFANYISKNASKKVASDKIWISPQGKIYDSSDTEHSEFIQDNIDSLGLSLKVKNLLKRGINELDIMVRYDWIRVYEDGAEGKINNLIRYANILDNFFLSQGDVYTYYFETPDFGNFAINKEDVVLEGSLKKVLKWKVNKVARKLAATEEDAWLSPEGTIYPLGNVKFHSTFILKNPDLFNIVCEKCLRHRFENELYQYAFKNGWVRLGTRFVNGNLKDIKRHIGIIENYLIENRAYRMVVGINDGGTVEFFENDLVEYGLKDLIQRHLKAASKKYSSLIPQHPWEMSKEEFINPPIIKADTGYRLLYHVTRGKGSAENIIQNGLLTSKATGWEGPRGAIWATSDPNSYSTNRTQIIFQVPVEDPNIEYVTGGNAQALIWRDIEPKDILYVDKVYATNFASDERLSWFRSSNYAEIYYELFKAAHEGISHDTVKNPEVLYYE